jgi:hypothetical protein
MSGLLEGTQDNEVVLAVFGREILDYVCNRLFDAGRAKSFLLIGIRHNCLYLLALDLYQRMR